MIISNICCCYSVAQLCPTFAIPWFAACQASWSVTIPWRLLKLTSIEFWCHPAISSSVVPFSSCLQSFPASGSFLMSWLFSLGGQSIGASASASVIPMNIQGWFSLGLTGLISLQSKGLSRVFPTPQFKSTNSLALSLLYGPTLISADSYWKNCSFEYTDLCWQSNFSVL